MHAEPSAIALVVLQVRALADADEVVTLSVDVDTLPDLARSNFVELVRFYPRAHYRFPPKDDGRLTTQIGQ